MKDSLQHTDFISGIYNYCDRWCARCPLRARCSVYAMERADREGLDSDRSGDFWKNLEGALATATSLLRELATEAGLDIDSILSESESNEANRRDRQAENYLLVCSANRYAERAYHWFAAGNVSALLAAETPLSETSPAATEVQGTADSPFAEENFRVILQYHSLISAKIFRAVQGVLQASPDGTDDDGGDADGSAKVALIAIDRSAAAWKRLLKILPEERACILDFLHQLERLQRLTEWTFPRARQFVRPGFDEG